MFLLQDSSDNNLLPQDVLSDAELDAQLDSLREKLVVVNTSNLFILQSATLMLVLSLRRLSLRF